MSKRYPEAEARYRLTHKADIAADTRRRAVASRNPRWAQRDGRGRVEPLDLSRDSGMSRERIGVVYRPEPEDANLVSVVDFSAHGPTGGLLR